jgi:beta-1,4-mannosyltransferase
MVGVNPMRCGSALRIGSWPGPGFTDNEFIQIFCEALHKCGAIVNDVTDPRMLDPSEIDVLQLHWAEQVFWRGFGRIKTIALIIGTLWAVRRVKKANVPVFWLVHNIEPHDATFFQRSAWRPYTKILSRLVDGFISLSPATLPIIEARFGCRSWQTNVWIRHPHYPIPDRIVPKKEARARWRTLDRQLLLAFVGTLRAYKGVESLISAIEWLKDPVKSGLLIGGSTNEQYAERLKLLAGGAPNIEIRARKLEKSEFEGLIQSSDYVVLPFKRTLHSGSIVHALSLGRPVLVPRTPYTVDLANVIGSQWVRVYDGEFSAEVIENLPTPPSDAPNLTALSPNLAANRLMDLYYNALGRAKRQRKR